jgi:signal transduction histidine kinase
MNLLVNAAQAINGEGVITIRTFREGDIVNVQFSDTGAGIRPDNLSRIFDPGFTTKGVGVGTGLGLSIVFQIIHDHGGSIDVDSEVGKGSTFTLRLPIHGVTALKNSQ